MVFPVLVLLMFAYLLGGGIAVPGGESYREFLVPGVFALTMVFGAESTTAAVSADAAKGVTDRFRTAPMSLAAVVTGRSLADMLHGAVGLLVMVGAGLLVGWRWDEGAVRALAAFGLLMLLRYAMVWVGIAVALAIRGPGAVQALQILVWPVAFLSTALVSTETMPAWLGAAAEWSPLSATATAVRELFGNPVGAGDSWATDHAPLLAVGWPLLLVAVLAPYAARRLRHS
jgi:ABC transporter DrrB family efflux protein